MKKLNEYEITQSYIGKTINFEKMLKIFTKNRNNAEKYIAYCDKFDKDKCSLFNITTTLNEYWGYYGILFSIFLEAENKMVCNCMIDKYKETGGYHGRPQTHVLMPSQQELRIFRRIMDYITL
jgi:hypothetical protein